MKWELLELLAPTERGFLAGGLRLYGFVTLMIQNPIPSSPHSIPLETPGLALLILEAHIRTIGVGITHKIGLSSFKSI